MWVSVVLETDAAHADALSDALLAAGAISVSVEDALAGTDLETPQFGEPDVSGSGPATPLWSESRVIALFDPSDDLIGRIAAATVAAMPSPPLCSPRYPRPPRRPARAGIVSTARSRQGSRSDRDRPRCRSAASRTDAETRADSGGHRQYASLCGQVPLFRVPQPLSGYQSCPVCS